jgi:uncharacterized membrane protein
MGLVWSIVGAFAGLALGALLDSGSLMAFGFVCGALIGVLLSRVSALGVEVGQLQRRMRAFDELATRPTRAETPRVATAPEAALDLRPAAASPVAAFDLPESFDIDVQAPLPPAPPTDVVDLPPPAATDVWQREAEDTAPSEDPGLRLFAWIKAWFSEGNLPVKVGMLVLLAGVAALLKYAADAGWFSLPIEFRIVGIALAAVAALVFAWRQRDIRRAFSLSVQGGAIGILLLTVFAAYRFYHLLPAAPAFALMVVLVAAVCVLAVVQDALALALLGMLAGFAAPILISTGSGNHVALFSYYAVLNVAVFTIAWKRSWRVLNLLGFFFTYAIGTLWGVLRYQPELFASTEPFLLLYFAIYLAIPVLHALRLGQQRPDAVDGTLIFGNPLVAFALQAALLDGDRMPLAMSALALGVLYAGLASALFRRLRICAESFAVLALGFSTLAVPLALSARTTGCIFALEGAALVWLGLRQQRRLPRWIGLLLQPCAAIAYGIALYDQASPDALPLANGPFLGALLIAGAGFVCAWLYRRSGRATSLSVVLYLWGLAWWLGGGLGEIERSVPVAWRLPAIIAMLGFTGWLAAEADRRGRRGALAWTVAALLWLCLPLGTVLAIDAQIFAGWNLIAPLAIAVFGWRSLACLRDRADAALATAHLGWLWSAMVILGLSLRRFGADIEFGSGWQIAMLALPLLLVQVTALHKPAWLAWPVADAFSGYRSILLGSQAGALVLLMLAGLCMAGSSAPLAFIPVLNPLELFLLGGLMVLARWTADADAPGFLRRHRLGLIPLAGFLLITDATLRAVHHLGGIGWHSGLLSASLTQTSLAVVWSILGVAGWVIGSRRNKRTLWLASALLMAVVLAKLLLIDRQHLGNLFGIASFMAYGLLCTLIGYLAPAPPRTSPPEAAR